MRDHPVPVGPLFSAASGTAGSANNRSVNTPQVRVNAIIIHDSLQQSPLHFI
jgi:hypothetical protein